MLFAPREVSDEGLLFTSGWEGFVDHPYRDIAGVWTWGYGHARVGQEPMPAHIDRPAGNVLLRVDMSLHCQPIDRLVPDRRISQRAMNALADWLFNCGPGAIGTRENPSGVLKAILDERWQDVPAMLRRWCMVTINGVKQANQGLLNRRIAEGVMVLKPDAPPIVDTMCEGFDGACRGLEIAVPDEEIAARGQVLLRPLVWEIEDEERRADLERRNREAGFDEIRSRDTDPDLEALKDTKS